MSNRDIEPGEILAVIIADARGLAEAAAVYARILRAYPHIDPNTLEVRGDGDRRYTVTARELGRVECVAVHIGLAV